MPDFKRIGELLSGQIKRCAAYSFADTRHLANMKRLDDFNKTVIDFIAGLAPDKR